MEKLSVVVKHISFPKLVLLKVALPQLFFREMGKREKKSETPLE